MNKIHFQNWPLRLCIPRPIALRIPRPIALRYGQFGLCTCCRVRGPLGGERTSAKPSACNVVPSVLCCFAFFHSSGTPQHLFHGGFSIAMLLQSYRRVMRPNGSLHLHLERKVEWENKSRKRIMRLSPVCRRFCRGQWLYIDLHCNKTTINPSQQHAGLREAILVSKPGISTNKTMPGKMQMALLKPLAKDHPPIPVLHQVLPAFPISTSKTMNKKTSKCWGQGVDGSQEVESSTLAFFNWRTH